MFGKHHTLKQLSGGIAIAAFLAVVAVPSAFASTFITDTLGGNGSPKALPDVFERYVAIHGSQSPQSQGITLITDTLGGNGSVKAPPDAQRYVAVHGATPAQIRGGTGRARQAYVNGGMLAAVATSNDQLHFSLPNVTVASPGGTGFNWGDAGIGAGLAAGLLLLLVGGTRLRTNKRGILTA